MSGSQAYTPGSEEEDNELNEYKERWKGRGLSFDHFVEDHCERAEWIRNSLELNRTISPKDFGKSVWFERDRDY
jgi:hypothetical protein